MQLSGLTNENQPEAAEPACKERELTVPADEVTMQDLIRGGVLDRWQIIHINRLPNAVKAPDVRFRLAKDPTGSDLRAEVEVSATALVDIYRQVPKQEATLKDIEIVADVYAESAEGDLAVVFNLISQLAEAVQKGTTS